MAFPYTEACAHLLGYIFNQQSNGILSDVENWHTGSCLLFLLVIARPYTIDIIACEKQTDSFFAVLAMLFLPLKMAVSVTCT